MQLLHAASLLPLLVASTMADPSVVPNLRSAAAASASAAAATPRELTTATTKQTTDVERGEPSYLEFYNYQGYCVGFDRKREGQKAKVVDCDDSDAAYVVYRDDDLLELYGTKLCLEADGPSIVLYECDEDDDEQQWFFPSQRINGKRFYRICNEKTRHCMERTGNKVELEKRDNNDKDQLFLLDSGFFDTE
jgi:Ricin-type beta-trefoil lectin domain